VARHFPYSPDLDSYDFFLFPQAECYTEGRIISEVNGDTNEYDIQLQTIRKRPTYHALESGGIVGVTEYNL